MTRETAKYETLHYDHQREKIQYGYTLMWKRKIKIKKLGCFCEWG
jgi:hypothetical protein